MTAASTRHALIIGASRGIGLEFVRQYRAEGVQVTATARSERALDTLRSLGAHVLQIDVARLESASAPAWHLDNGGFDVAVVCAGVYGPRDAEPLKPPGQAEFDEVMHTNVLGAMRVLPQIAESLVPQAKLAVISSRMGSIGSRTDPRGWLYRASKAALNSVLKDVSLALAGQATCVSLHPGWVQTDMGGAGADLDVTRSVSDMRRLLDSLTPDDNGRFLNHDGADIGW